MLVDFSSFSQYYQGSIDFNNLGMHFLIFTDGKGSDIPIFAKTLLLGYSVRKDLDGSSQVVPV